MASSPLTCVACHDPLVMQVDPDSDNESDSGHDHSHFHSHAGASSSSSAQQQQREETVPDDLQLPCGCHYHWPCALDLSPQIAATLSCLNCNTTLTSSPSTGIQALYSSEGAESDPIDLLPIIIEEAHLQSHAEERPARALHTMVGEGDVEGIVEILKDADAPEERAALLSYRDPLAGGRTALHVAVENGRADAFWLLLWTASNLPTDNFSLEMRQTMGSIGLERGLVVGGEDLRFVKDGEGRTAGDYAAASGQWDEWINGGVFMLRG
ncbi:hypothetical protein GE09DRAFT_315811 [Coniochaeta sp. 2T2.1]|nr:hypothetical protein GE09DRAFT_315811 [Coniochaeta sp. 2T2.1]